MAEQDRLIKFPVPLYSRGGNDPVHVATFAVQKGLKVGSTIYESLELTLADNQTYLVEVDLSETPSPDDLNDTTGAQYFFPMFVRIVSDKAWRYSTSKDSFHPNGGSSTTGFFPVAADVERDIPVGLFRKFRIAAGVTGETPNIRFEIRGTQSGASRS